MEIYSGKKTSDNLYLFSSKNDCINLESCILALARIIIIDIYDNNIFT